MTQAILTPVDRRSFLGGLLGAGLAGCAHAMASTDGAELPDPHGDVAPVHDPCIIRADGLYHVFSTGQEDDEYGLIAWRTSPDLGQWTWRGAVFDAIPAWARKAIPGTRGIWAPDIAHFRRPVSPLLLRLDFRFESLGYRARDSDHAGSRTSVGRLAGSRPGARVPSGRRLTTRSTPITSRTRTDGIGSPLGSFWSGIKLFELDPATGRLADGAQKHALARRPVPEHAPGAIEAPFVIRRGAYYYCCFLRLLLPRRGQFLLHRRGPCARADRPLYRARRASDVRWLRHVAAPRKSAFSRAGTLRGVAGWPHADYLVYHAYDADADGRPTLRISRIDWSDDGWPSVSG